jgi:hypothetical protein
MSRFSIVEITLICVSYFCTTSPRTCISCRVVSVLYGICMHLSMLAVDGIMPCHIPIILESFLNHSWIILDTLSSFCWTCCSCHVFIPNPSHPQRVLSPVWGTAGCQLEGCRGPTAHGGWGLATRVAWQIGVTMDILNDIMIYSMLDILDIFIRTYYYHIHTCIYMHTSL